MTIAASYWPAAIGFMYSGKPKTRRNRRPIAAVFAPAAIGPPQLLVFPIVPDAGKNIKELCAWFYLHINPPCFSLWCCVFDTEIIVSCIFLDYILTQIIYTHAHLHAYVHIPKHRYMFIYVCVRFFFPFWTWMRNSC